MAERRSISTTFTRFKHKISDEELKLLVDKLAESPDNYDLMDWAAFAFYSNGDLERSIEFYTRLVTKFPQNASYHYYLGNSHWKLDQREVAANHWRRVIDLDKSGNFSDRAHRKLQNLTKG